MTRVRRAHSFVLDLSTGQRAAVERMADGRRAAYNFALALDRDAYAADLPPADWGELEPDWEQPRWNERRSLGSWDLGKTWTPAWRALTPWNQAAGQPAQIAFGDYTKARDAAIKRKRGFPRFRSRYDPHQTVSFAQGVSVAGEAIKVPTLGALRVKGSTRRLAWFLVNRSGTIQQAHLVRPGVHAPWRCVIIVEIDQADAPVHTGPIVGLDLGISHFLTLSTGEAIENPRPLQVVLRRLRIAQKSVSRSEQIRQAEEATARAPGALGKHQRLPKSHRQVAKEAVVTRIHARVASLRSEFHHTLAKRLVAEFSAIGIEDLNIAGLAKNRRIARHIADVGWASFLRILAYKADAAGVEIVKADRWFASSQRCADCGTINPAVKDLSVRRWTCINPDCGITHERDLNAARNLVPSPVQIALARSVRLAEREQARRKRQAHKDRSVKSASTKEASRLARHQERLAQHAIHDTNQLVAVTPTETLNARRGPVRPNGTTMVVPAVARTETPLRREEARTEHPPLRIHRRSRVSLGALGSPHLVVSPSV